MAAAEVPPCYVAQQRRQQQQQACGGTVDVLTYTLQFSSHGVAADDVAGRGAGEDRQEQHMSSARNSSWVQQSRFAHHESLAAMRQYPFSINSTSTLSLAAISATAAAASLLLILSVTLLGHARSMALRVAVLGVGDHARFTCRFVILTKHLLAAAATAAAAVRWSCPS
jgi:hypothetical protein